MLEFDRNFNRAGDLVDGGSVHALSKYAETKLHRTCSSGGDVQQNDAHLLWDLSI